MGYEINPGVENNFMGYEIGTLARNGLMHLKYEVLHCVKNFRIWSFLVRFFPHLD